MIYAIIQSRTLVYIICSLLAATGLFLYYRKPSPFGYRDPLKLFRHTYETFDDMCEDDVRL